VQKLKVRQKDSDHYEFFLDREKVGVLTVIYGSVEVKFERTGEIVRSSYVSENHHLPEADRYDQLNRACEALNEALADSEEPLFEFIDEDEDF